MNRTNIAAVGMPQGGTTALYNIINFIFMDNKIFTASALYHSTGANAGEGALTVVNEDLLRKISAMEDDPKIPRVIIVKEHHFVPFLCNEWADIIFVMKRDIRDSIASRRRRGKPLISKGKIASDIHDYDPKTFEGFKTWCRYLTDDCFQRWVDAAKQNKTKIHIVDYAEYKTNPKLVIKLIYEQLQQYNSSLKLDEDKILYTVNNLQEYDRNTTFFSPAMVTGGGKNNNFKDHLNQQELDYIQNNFKDWINNERDIVQNKK